MSEGPSAEIQRHVEALKQAIATLDCPSAEDPQTRVKREQLRAIEKVIRQLERSKLPVPGSLVSECQLFRSKIQAAAGDSSSAAQAYEGLLPIIEELGRMCGHRPHRDFSNRFRERGRDVTAPETLKNALLEALERLRGRAQQRDVLEAIGKQLQATLTKVDRDRTRGTYPRWQQEVRRQAKALIEVGRIKKERGGIWALSE